MIFGVSISLGPILPADFPSLFRWADDFDAARLNDVYRPAVVRSQEEYWLNTGNDASKVLFAIRKLNMPPIIGYVQIKNIDPIHRSAIIGIRIGDEANRSQGYGTEALRLAISYCWNHLNLSRIELTVFGTNPRAAKLYSSLGFDTEGVLRKAIFIDGHWLDVVLMGLLHPTRANGSTIEA
ncbi:MAG TPA: GNAT family protein [Telmatospirillum sp.]|nr:GNAT family protein [Telmatospirillum sp.]